MDRTSTQPRAHDHMDEAAKVDLVGQLLAHGIALNDEMPSLMHALQWLVNHCAAFDLPALPADIAGDVRRELARYQEPSYRLLDGLVRRQRIEEGLAAADALLGLMGRPQRETLALGERRLKAYAGQARLLSLLIEKVMLEARLAPGGDLFIPNSAG